MPNISDRLEKNKLANIPTIIIPSTFSFLKLSTTKKQTKMIAKHPADLKRYFCLLQLPTSALLHFGQCILFICDMVYPKIVIIRQNQLICKGIFWPLLVPAVTIMLNHQFT